MKTQMSDKEQLAAWTAGRHWRKESPVWLWEEGYVDASREHIELRYGNAFKTDSDAWKPVAQLGKPVGMTFPVHWLLQEKKAPRNIRMFNEAVRELNYYLIQLMKADAWEYAIHHCLSGSNMYSRIHWAYFPSGLTGERVSGRIVQVSKEEYQEMFGEDEIDKF
jgi:hypothetical protein